MPALDAIHLKAIWAEDLVGNEFLRSMMDSFTRSVSGKDRGQAEAKAFMEETGEDLPVTDVSSWVTAYVNEPGRFAVDTRRWLDAGLAYYVDPRIHQLVTAAAESMPEETVVERDLPSDYGFMLIPGGLSVIDIRGRALVYNAVQWALFGGTIRVLWLTDKYDTKDSSNLIGREKLGEHWFDRMPRLTVGHASELRLGLPLPLTFGPDFMVPPDRKMRVIHHRNEDGSESYGWQIDDNGYTPEELQEKMTISVRTDPAMRWLLTCWRMMQQTITSVTEETAPRQMRRQLERKNLDTKVTVIALRHRAARGDGHTEVEWSHRWLVRGHWRHQRCKEDGEWTTRLIYIHPHIKGPEDAPLIIRDHVYSLVR